MNIGFIFRTYLSVSIIPGIMKRMSKTAKKLFPLNYSMKNVGHKKSIVKDP